ncbi:MAG: cupin domain-containing protein [Bacteroidetes bacterium]|nr:cupin domain-containing protein [Bacteroidota bacterium]
MAVNIYEQCTNPITGEIFKCISADSYVFKIQWVKKAGSVHGASPHAHVYQDEIFYVNKGRLKMLVENKERVAGPGEKIIVGKGKSHIVVNTPDELDITLECRPALDYGKFMQCFKGLVEDGYTNEKGYPDSRMMGYFMKKMKCRSVTIPEGITLRKFKWTLNKYYLLGTMNGWGKLYKRYTE